MCIAQAHILIPLPTAMNVVEGENRGREKGENSEGETTHNHTMVFKLTFSVKLSGLYWVLEKTLLSETFPPILSPVCTTKENKNYVTLHLNLLLH